MMTKRAILYARVSTAEQESSGYSLPTQLEAMRTEAAKYGLTIPGKGYEIQDDCSGGIRVYDRPGGRRVYEAIRRGEVEAVIVYQVDRLSRNLADLLVTIDEWLRAGIELYFMDVGRVQSENDILIVIKGWQGTDEKKKIRERTMRGRRGKVEDGKLPGNGTACFGYRKVGYRKETQWVIDEAEAEIVRLIFRWYMEGDGDGIPLGVVEIADRLTAMGVPSCADRRTWKSRKDRTLPEWSPKQNAVNAWTPGIVYPILKREAYIGTWHAYRYQMVEGEGGKKKSRRRRPPADWLAVSVPAIIDRATWDKAQARLKDGRHEARGTAHHEYLLTGRLKCSCGYHAQGKPCTARGRLYLYYQCNGTNRAITIRRCHLPGFRATAWDAVVWNWIEGLLLDPANLSKRMQAEQHESELANAPYVARLATIERKIEEAGIQLRRAMDLYIDGQQERDWLEVRRDQLRQTREELEREREDVKATLAANTLTDQQIETIDTLAGAIGGRLPGATFETKRQALELLQFSGRLVVENGEKVMYAKCIVDAKRLSLESSSSYNCRDYQNASIVFTARLTLADRLFSNVGVTVASP